MFFKKCEWSVVFVFYTWLIKSIYTFLFTYISSSSFKPFQNKYAVPFETDIVLKEQSSNKANIIRYMLLKNSKAIERTKDQGSKLEAVS